MLKINEEKRTIEGKTLDYDIYGSYYIFEEKITYVNLDVTREGYRQKVSIYLDVDKFGGENYQAEINWPGFGAEDIAFAQEFKNLLSVAICEASRLEELVKDFNNK